MSYTPLFRFKYVFLVIIMKQIYLLILSSLLAMPLTLQARNSITREGDLVRIDDIPDNMVIDDHRTTDSESRKEVGLTGAAENEGPKSIEGRWYFCLGDYYFDDSVFDEKIGAYDASITSDGFLTFSCPDGSLWSFKAIYQESSSKLLFPAMYIGSTSNYYVFQEPYVYITDEDGDYVETLDEMYATYDAQQDAIIFEPDHGIMWAGYRNLTSADSYAGNFDMLDFVWATRNGLAPAGIEPVIADETDTNSVYYDIYGRRVINPQKGQFVVRLSGGKATKMIVK